MSDIQEMLEWVSGRLKAFRHGLNIYHATLSAGKIGQQIEQKMLEMEIDLLAVSRQLTQIQLAADMGNLAEVQRLLAEKIEVNLPPETG